MAESDHNASPTHIQNLEIKSPLSQFDLNEDTEGGVIVCFVQGLSHHRLYKSVRGLNLIMK